MTRRPVVTIYTKRWCGYCWAARRLFGKLGIDFEEIPLDGNQKLRREIAATAGNWPTVPMVFLGKRFIGGYTELAQLHRKGDLLPACEQKLL